MLDNIEHFAVLFGEVRKVQNIHNPSYNRIKTLLLKMHPFVSKLIQFYGLEEQKYNDDG